LKRGFAVKRRFYHRITRANPLLLKCRMARSPQARWLRRAGLLTALGVWSLACGGGEAAPVDDEMEFLFAEPRRVEVVDGDTLEAIATREAVTVDEIRGWNGLEGDALEPGQVLLLWDSRASDRAKPKTGADRVPQVADGAPTEPAPAAPPRPFNPIRRWLIGDDDDADPAPAPASDGVADAAPAEAAPEAKPSRWSPAGILGVDLEDGSADLERDAQSMKRHDSDLDGSGLDGRRSGYADGGTAETIEVDSRQPGQYGGVQIPNTPVTPPRLAKPTPKRCLAGPTEGELRGDEDMVGNRGLDEAQVRAGMSKVVRSSAQCFPAGTSGSYSVIVELVVGCDGVVDHTRLVSGGVVPAHVTNCIEQTVAYAGFPAHATPDGVAFHYPLQYTF
jgi:hypothetical protein